MNIKIPVVALYTDCGDGGWNADLYNSEEELLAGHPAVQSAIEEGASEDELARIKKDILTEDDPYANGLISHETLDIEVDHNAGTARLRKPLGMHFGQ